ncbi:MAG: hypothetical protein AAGA60_14755 [Cyanobacteria bacterium P01_E01_bin.42]
MPALNLSELSLLKRQAQGKPLYFSKSSELQRQLQFIIRQKRLGLPIQSLLKNHPLLDRWIQQLEECFPPLFCPKKKLFLNLPLMSRLYFTSNHYELIEIKANIGFVNNKIRVFEWSVRQPKVNWQDKVKLWVVANYFKIDPNRLKMTIFALHPDRRVQRIITRSNRRSHYKVERLLKDLLVGKQAKNSRKSIRKYLELTNIDAIEEVPL